MKRTLALILAAAALHANAATTPPDCWTVSGATGYTMTTTDDGVIAAWWCPDSFGDWSLVTLTMRAGYVLKHPAIPASAAATDIALAYWKENVTIDCAVPTPTQADANLCNAAKAAGLKTRPAPQFVVRPNGTAKTRPTYPLAGGVRGTVSNGSVDVIDATGRPTACNPAEKLVVGSSTYMQVKRTPGTVALCKAGP
jgi:hypothetical protein